MLSWSENSCFLDSLLLLLLRSSHRYVSEHMLRGDEPLPTALREVRRHLRGRRGRVQDEAGDGCRQAGRARPQGQVRWYSLVLRAFRRARHLRRYGALPTASP